jgi:hypothetical protein
MENCCDNPNNEHKKTLYQRKIIVSLFSKIGVARKVNYRKCALKDEFLHILCCRALKL